MAPSRSLIARHCEERSDEAIQGAVLYMLDCFASLARTKRRARDSACRPHRLSRDAAAPSAPVAKHLSYRAPVVAAPSHVLASSPECATAARRNPPIRHPVFLPLDTVTSVNPSAWRG